MLFTEPFRLFTPVPVVPFNPPIVPVLPINEVEDEGDKMLPTLFMSSFFPFD